MARLITRRNDRVERCSRSENLRVEIGTPSNLSGDLPDGHEWGESSSFDRGLPNFFVTLGDISKALGADTTRFGGDE